MTVEKVVFRSLGMTWHQSILNRSHCAPGIDAAFMSIMQHVEAFERVVGSHSEHVEASGGVEINQWIDSVEAASGVLAGRSWPFSG